MSEIVVDPEFDDVFFWDHIQGVLSEYILEDGETAVSRDEAREIWRKILGYFDGTKRGGWWQNNSELPRNATAEEIASGAVWSDEKKSQP